MWHKFILHSEKSKEYISLISVKLLCTKCCASKWDWQTFQTIPLRAIVFGSWPLATLSISGVNVLLQVYYLISTRPLRTSLLLRLLPLNLITNWTTPMAWKVGCFSCNYVLLLIKHLISFLHQEMCNYTKLMHTQLNGALSLFTKLSPTGPLLSPLSCTASTFITLVSCSDHHLWHSHQLHHAGTTGTLGRRVDVINMSTLILNRNGRLVIELKVLIHFMPNTYASI